jgi:hypothetical protein
MVALLLSIPFVVVSNVAFTSRGVIPNMTISNRHIRIHCIDFELDHDQLPPLIYVEDLSTNGTFIIGSYDQKDENSRKLGLNHPLLVKDADQLRLGDHVTCVFECFMKDSPRSLTTIQLLEAKVRPLALSMITETDQDSTLLATTPSKTVVLGLEETRMSSWRFTAKRHSN